MASDENGDPCPVELPRAARGGLVALALAGAAALRLYRLGVPLERDEGEFAYVGQLILQGETPFVAAYNMKFPGIYYAYAGILAAGGESVAAIRLGHLAVNAAAIALVYLLGRRVAGASAAALAAVAYAALSVLPPVLGFFAHATHFVVAAALAGLWLLERERDRPPRAGALFAAGLALGVGVTMKQHGAAFAAFGLVVLATRLAASSGAGLRRNAGLLAAFAVGGLLPSGLIVALLHQHGALGTFWFWTVEYGARYATLTGPARGLANLLVNAWPLVLGGALPLWLFAAGGAAVAARGRFPVRRTYLLGLLTASCLAMTPGLYFRPHYFVLVLPVASLLAGLGLVAAGRALAGARGPAVAGVLLAACLAWTGLVYGRTLVTFGPDRVSHAIYGDEFFPEMRDLARELHRRSDPGDHVAVLGSEPEIYFYADRRAATGYLYVYPLLEPQPAALRMQRQMAREIGAARPRYVVYVHAPNSWGLREDSERFLMRWMDSYLRRYRRVGLVELRAGGGSRFFWDSAARRRPTSSAWAAVYEWRAGGRSGSGDDDAPRG